MEYNAVQRQLLNPLLLVFAGLFICFTLLLFNAQEDGLRSASQSTVEGYREEFQASFQQERDLLISLQHLILDNSAGVDALAEVDRNGLLEIYGETFIRLRQEQNITHFYFHSPDLINIIRLHNFDRFGDRINRITSLNARQEGTVSAGFELGVLGTFTLRVVMPVYRNNTLVGYIELGKEIEDIARTIARTYDLDWMVMINKEHLDKQGWTQGNEVFGKQRGWDDFTTRVVSSESLASLPDRWFRIVDQLRGENPEIISLPATEGYWYLGIMPLLDIQGARVGELLLFMDQKAQREHSLYRNLMILAGLFVVMLLLLIALRVVLRKADQKIQDNQQKLHHLAHHDELTKLPNRKFFYQRLHHAVVASERHDRKLAILFIDLDGFKDINDTMGHSVGDQLLQEVALRMRRLVRMDDTLARNSGDEFVILLEDISSANNCAATADKLLKQFVEPCMVEGKPVSVSMSIGISLFPQDAQTPDTLVRNADSAMYQAKKAGRNCYYFYNEDMTRTQLRRVMLEQQIRVGLKEHNFYLHYQPQIDLENGRCFGIEVLLRWHDQMLGQVGPDEFIPVAEEAGLINELGNWVLVTACTQAKAWLDQGVEFGKVAINISGKQLQTNMLPEIVSEALQQSGLPASYLELEITESVLMTNISKSVGQIEAIRAMGVIFSIDDFGTGYSSLSQLKSLPIQTLKIDRSFIKDLPGDPNDCQIARTIISMANFMGLSIIAEGVETREQLDFLRDNGCTQLQGYLFSPPVNAESLEVLISNRLIET